MQDLILYYNSKKKSIDSYDFEEFKNILRGDASTTVSREAQGLLFLSDGGIIKCVKNYYLDSDGGQIPKSKSSDSCHSILNEFDVSNVKKYECSCNSILNEFDTLTVRRYECRKCHLRFVNFFENNIVRLKSSKKQRNL